MPFNVALTGIRAATADLEVTGNNVANASTTGFKKSTVQFGDLYANSFLSGSMNQIGDGVRVQSITQNFGQGNLSFTDSNLDLAINGQGFFVLDNAGARQYSRAGNFGVDNQGYITTNSGMRLQGYTANDDEVIGGVLGPLQVDSENLAPRRTTGVNTALNLNSSATVLRRNWTEVSSPNGFEGRELQLALPDGRTHTFPATTPVTPADAQQLASDLSTYPGVRATATGTSIDVVLDEGVTLDDVTGVAGGGAPVSLGSRVDAFDPLDQNTYNHTTSSTVYDSLGNAHVMSMYFVKEPTVPGLASSPWSMYVQIDGRDVGNPNPLDPANPTAPTRARFDLLFNADGSVNAADSEFTISNWQPLGPDGRPNGAAGPNNAGLITEPPTTSNFRVDMTRLTQYGSPFSVSDMQQNGFTTGRMSGLDVNDNGVIFARYTNGQSRVLAQVAMASFKDMEGLASVGETTWVETYRSGPPLVGIPGTATLGSIRANSLEDSNVDLSEQLVNLIVAQRNYQANAKTIETANAVTQTIINLR